MSTWTVYSTHLAAFADPALDSIFDHTIRRHPPKGTVVRDTPSTRMPVNRVHVDQTPESGRARVFRHDPDEAEDFMKGRVRLINVWR